MSSSRNHWILTKPEAYAAGFWPVYHSISELGTYTRSGPRDVVRCTNGRPHPGKIHAPATHAAGFDFITGKGGRLASRVVYLCPPCADRFTREHAPRTPAHRGTWTGQPVDGGPDAA